MREEDYSQNHFGLLRMTRRQQAKRKGSTGINLVSLMDIFTILVFFLLVNSAEVETLSGNKSIKLPESVSEKKPEESLLITVNQTSLIVQGKPIAAVADIQLNDENSLIEPLSKELQYHSQRKQVGSEQTNGTTQAVTIMGDKEIPYKLLKKIMMTCAQANYGNISLAVQQKPSSSG